MNVECPSCQTKNDVVPASDACTECEAKLSGHLYKKFKKPLISATTAFFIGGFGVYKADQLLFDTERYPVEVEYEVVDNCANSVRSLISSRDHVRRVEVCACALENTMAKVSYGDLKKSESTFVTRFRKELASCS